MKIRASIQTIHAALSDVQKIYPSVRFERGYPKPQGKQYIVCLAANSGEPGSRNSASGRKMPKASWEAHRDFLAGIFDQEPNAKVTSALATYDGADDFLKKFLATGFAQIGQGLCIRNVSNQ